MAVPSLRFKEFGDGWKESTMKELTKINQGLQIPIADRLLEEEEDSYFYITNEFLRVGSQSKYYIKNPSKSVTCNESDVLMTRTGNTGQVVTGVKGAFHNNFFKIAFESDVLDRKFLVEFLRLSETQNMILRYAGTSTIPDLNHGDFYRLKINLPSLPEQGKIADFLSAVDEKIRLLTEKKEKLETYKKGVMQKLFPKQGQTNPELRFKRPDGTAFPDWEEKRLGEFIKSYKLGGNYSNSELDSGNPLIKMGNLDRGRIDLSKIEFIQSGEEIDSIDLVNLGDLFFNTRNTLDLVGKVAIWRGELKKAYFNSNLMRMEFECNGFMNERLNSYDGLKALRSIATGTTSVAAIYTKDLLKIKLKVPVLEEQVMIYNFLEDLESKRYLMVKEINQMKDFKKGLLQQMFV